MTDNNHNYNDDSAQSDQPEKFNLLGDQAEQEFDTAESQAEKPAANFDMAEQVKYSQPEAETPLNIKEPGRDLPSPDYSKIREKPQNQIFKKALVLLAKLFVALIIVVIIGSIILGFIYYQNITKAYTLAFSAKDHLELAVHKVTNREFKEAADLINQSHAELVETKNLLDQIIIVRYVPYAGRQLKAVDNLLIAGIKLTDSGEKVVLLLEDITAPLANESITYLTITPEQKRDILNKIVASEGLLLEVQQQIDEAAAAIDLIPDDGLIGPLREGVEPVKEYLPKLKNLIDQSLPMIKVVPKIVGFDQAKTYLFLLQNNSELRPTGGFIGTYGVLTLQDGEITQFDTDNVYNLDRAPQYILQEPAPEPIAKYLEQKYLSLRDVNWSPDFPTTAEKALYMYREEHRIWNSLKESGTVIVGEENVVLTDIIPYQEVDGVIAVTPEVIAEALKITGPIVVDGIPFTSDNLVDELEFIVGREFRELDIPISQRKEIIKKLADQIKLRFLSMPIRQIPDMLDIVFNSLSQKQVLFYSRDSELESLIIERDWGGDVKKVDSDYLLVVDSNLASLKTDQFVDRSFDYQLQWQGDDVIATVTLIYNNQADFTWKSTRLRNYNRIFVPLGSELIEVTGAMDNDKVKDPEGKSGEIATGEELNKTYFGAFISIEPKETGQLIYKYKLPARISTQIRNGDYNLLVQKQPGVIPNLTLDLKFAKTIKSAVPAELESEWFNTSYNYAAPLIKDSYFNVSFK